MTTFFMEVVLALLLQGLKGSRAISKAAKSNPCGPQGPVIRCRPLQAMTNKSC